jgi:hypothetical protein
MRCPSLNIFGTFFPSWMLCAVLGIVVAIAAYRVIAVLRVDGDLHPALLFYPSIALSVTFIFWLTLYGQ